MKTNAQGKIAAQGKTGKVISFMGKEPKNLGNSIYHFIKAGRVEQFPVEMMAVPVIRQIEDSWSRYCLPSHESARQYHPDYWVGNYMIQEDVSLCHNPEFFPWQLAEDFRSACIKKTFWAANSEEQSADVEYRRIYGGLNVCVILVL